MSLWHIVRLFLAGMLLGVGLAWMLAPPAGADPTCGENSYYDYAHNICQPFATPYPYYPPYDPWPDDDQR